ncbi:MAG: hypothetical protein IM531_12720 [Pseudanabaena sp. M090S1SP1A06QC]|nr:hypothetical protein [Pseudanabaena sp. M109S1SP1A06QC]MCA6604031.1 hypothetical protein [Pseudanabaena sp. M007S1SP1A06QC]MCA6615519.1 hypothetical protein [Pseudanabaena sp. M090S1SP1A06QC]MCA6624508.1 hypothetical protein [Pseudanabaena sp. M165S2SP1A06QC]
MIFIKDKSLAITGATSILFFSSVGASNAIGLTSIPISSFSVTVAGNTSNAASSTGTLNTSSDSEALTGLNATDSFNSFFSSDFISVGALGTDKISGSSQGTNSTIKMNAANAFTLTSADLNQPLQITFNYIFRGTADPLLTPPNFLVQLIKFTGVGDNSTVARNFLNLTAPDTGTGTYADNGSYYAFEYEQEAFSTSVNTSGLTEGNYGISISLTEPTGGVADNQAAGFNQFSVQSIPFDFDPSLGIGLLGLGFGLNKLRKNLKAKKNTEI